MATASKTAAIFSRTNNPGTSMQNDSNSGQMLLLLGNRAASQNCRSGRREVHINQDPAPVVYVVGLHGVVGDRAAEDKADGDDELPEGQGLHGPRGDLPARQTHNQRQQWAQVCPDVACTPCVADVSPLLCAAACNRRISALPSGSQEATRYCGR